MTDFIWGLISGLVTSVFATFFYIRYSGWVKYKKEEWDNRYLKDTEDEFNGYKVRWEYGKDGNGIRNIQLQCRDCNEYSEIFDSICGKCQTQVDYQNIETQIQEKIKKKYWKNIPVIPKIKHWVL